MSFDSYHEVLIHSDKRCFRPTTQVSLALALPFTGTISPLSVPLTTHLTLKLISKVCFDVSQPENRREDLGALELVISWISTSRFFTLHVMGSQRLCKMLSDVAFKEGGEELKRHSAFTQPEQWFYLVYLIQIIKSNSHWFILQLT